MDNRQIQQFIGIQNQFKELEQLIKLAISHYGSFNDRYLHRIVMEAQQIKNNHGVINTGSLRFSNYSIPISGSTAYDVCSIANLESRKLEIEDLKLLLEIVESL